MSIAEALAQACRAVPHPVGLLARDGTVLASSALFTPPLYPLPERGVFPEGARDLLVIPLGDVQLVVELPSSPVADVAEAALLVRKLAQVHRRTRQELEEALSQAEVLRLVAEVERLVALPSDAALSELAAELRKLAGGLHVHVRMMLPGGRELTSGRGQPLEGAHLFRHHPAPDVQALVLVEGPVPASAAEVLQLVAQRLGAAAMREALREEQAATRAAQERARVAAELAREAARPLSELLVDLEAAKARLAASEASVAADAADLALGEAMAAARKVLEVVHQLEAARAAALAAAAGDPGTPAPRPGGPAESTTPAGPPAGGGADGDAKPPGPG